jgi:hypothetical protein
VEANLVVTLVMFNLKLVVMEVNLVILKVIRVNSSDVGVGDGPPSAYLVGDACCLHLWLVLVS